MRRRCGYESSRGHKHDGNGILIVESQIIPDLRFSVLQKPIPASCELLFRLFHLYDRSESELPTNSMEWRCRCFCRIAGFDAKLGFPCDLHPITSVTLRPLSPWKDRLNYQRMKSLSSRTRTSHYDYHQSSRAGHHTVVFPSRKIAYLSHTSEFLLIVCSPLRQTEGLSVLEPFSLFLLPFVLFLFTFIRIDYS